MVKRRETAIPRQVISLVRSSTRLIYSFRHFVTTPARSWFFLLNSSEGSETIWAMRTSMKTKLLLATFLLSATLAATFSAPQQKSESASKILALENKWNEAYKQGDVAAMNSLLAEDFIITVEDGTTFSKAGYIAHSADSDNRVLISEMSVHGWIS